jgi:GNAT superfamily N-acetyltransferase
MKLVQNKKEYWDFIRDLRNHEDVKVGFIQQQHIGETVHQSHMSLFGECYYVCLVNNIPAGYVGVIDRDIRVATHPSFQGKGVGKYMINELMKKHPDSFAKVKVENTTSMRLFEACGFKKKYYILEKE